MGRHKETDGIRIGNGAPLVLIAGPCVIENPELTMDIARQLKVIAQEFKLPFIFKASFDKANRTSIHSYRGPGVAEGLKVLQWIKSELDIPVLSDVHREEEVEAAASVLDIIQIPAFLCRQTDLILAVGRSGKIVNIKKGQFLSPWDVRNVVEKVASTGNNRIWITERGTIFGYNNLVVDFRSVPILQKLGYPVIFDATHSVQIPGGSGTVSGGDREFVPALARAAVAAGADGVFLEVHPIPEEALCDGPNSLRLEEVPDLLRQLAGLHRIVVPSGE